MNVRDRLREAYENVSFNADTTWADSASSYHNANMKLFLTEHDLEKKKLESNRPRTVKECIPESRLAQYSNYVYNESREMSYASSSTTAKSDVNFISLGFPREPWEMPEVGELFRWFLKSQSEDDFSKQEGYHHESPLLNVTGFEDKIIKIQITEDRVKNMWKNVKSCEYQKKEQRVTLQLCTSPMRKFFLFQANPKNFDWFRGISISKDLEKLEKLMNCFREISSLGTWSAPQVAEPSTSTEILYSEVLQGLSPSRKFLNNKLEENAKIAPVGETSTTPSSSNLTILYSQRSQEASSPPKAIVSRPQTYFYSHFQRWIPQFYPGHIFHSSWFLQNQNCKNYQPDESNTSDRESHPVVTTASEELEIQALEQYTPSNENFYQELERQAVEQYTSSPE